MPKRLHEWNNKNQTLGLIERQKNIKKEWSVCFMQYGCLCRKCKVKDLIDIYGENIEKEKGESLIDLFK